MMKSWGPTIKLWGGPGVQLLNFRGVPGPTFKLWEGSRVPDPRVPSYQVLRFWSHFYIMPVSVRKSVLKFYTVASTEDSR